MPHSSLALLLYIDATFGGGGEKGDKRSFNIFFTKEQVFFILNWRGTN